MKPVTLFRYSIYLLFLFLILTPVLYILIIPFQSACDTILIEKHRLIILAEKSLILAFGAAFLSLFIGIPIAFTAYRMNKYKFYFIILASITVFIPPYIHAIVWNQLSPYIISWFSVHSLFGNMLVLSLIYYPYIFILTLSGLQTMDRSYIESALLYQKKMTVVRKIIFPLIVPHIFSGAIFVFILSIVDFSVSDILGVNVYAMEIFIKFSAFYDEKSAMQLSMPFIGLTIMLLFLQQWHMKNRSYIHQFADISVQSKDNTLNPYKKYFLIVFCLIIFSLSVVLPVCVLLYGAGKFSNYINALTLSWDQVTYTFVLSFLGTTLVMLMGFSIAYMIERSDHKLKYCILLISIIPFAVPGTTIGVCMIMLWNRPVIDAVYSSSLILLFAYLLKFIPIAVVIFISALKNINRQIEEAASLLTSNVLIIIFRIVLP
ncbi:iron (III) ABC transporter permease, partial [Candidatus Magnetomorum sp. HK-1]